MTRPRRGYRRVMTSVRNTRSDVEITHGDRVVFPDVSLTKRDVVEYYRRVADRMMPHLRDRPLVLYRFPDGLDGDGFFQKQTPTGLRESLATASVPRRRGGAVEHAVVCDDADDLLRIVNQGAFEIHALLTHATTPDRPDQIVLDLDPSTDDIEPVIEAARATRAVLADLDVASFVKSTGSRGVHVHILLDAETDIDDVHDLSRRLAELIVAEDPDAFTVAQRRNDRGERVYIDWLRNGYGQHAVVPYSVRARPRAPVSLPMDWDEVTAANFDPQAFTVANAFRRLAQKRDPWEAMDSSPRCDAGALARSLP